MAMERVKRQPTRWVILKFLIDPVIQYKFQSSLWRQTSRNNAKTKVPPNGKHSKDMTQAPSRNQKYKEKQLSGTRFLLSRLSCLSLTCKTMVHFIKMGLTLQISRHESEQMNKIRTECPKNTKTSNYSARRQLQSPPGLVIWHRY